MIAFLTNSFLLSLEATMGENLLDPSFQPPMASIVFRFLLYVFKPVNLAYPPVKKVDFIDAMKSLK